jgi:hypothetical protein
MESPWFRGQRFLTRLSVSRATFTRHRGRGRLLGGRQGSRAASRSSGLAGRAKFCLAAWGGGGANSGAEDDHQHVRKYIPSLTSP